MSRFYFHLYDDLDVPDEEGAEMANLEAAVAYGLANVRALAADQVTRGNLDLRHRIEIADAQGQVLGTIRFADAVEVVALNLPGSPGQVRNVRG